MQRSVSAEVAGKLVSPRFGCQVHHLLEDALHICTVHMKHLTHFIGHFAKGIQDSQLSLSTLQQVAAYQSQEGRTRHVWHLSPMRSKALIRLKFAARALCGAEPHACKSFVEKNRWPSWTKSHAL